MPRWPLPVLIALLPSLAIAGSPPAKPARLGLCAACHGETGNATQAGIPHLAAQDREYLAAALRQYRSNARISPAMRAAAGVLSDADIDALAAWYAAQPRSAGGAR
jgi:cytochrome c553